jgi:hypothetical protein
MACGQRPRRTFLTEYDSCALDSGNRRAYILRQYSANVLHPLVVPSGTTAGAPPRQRLGGDQTKARVDDSARTPVRRCGKRRSRRWPCRRTICGSRRSIGCASHPSGPDWPCRHFSARSDRRCRPAPVSAARCCAGIPGRTACRAGCCSRRRASRRGGCTGSDGGCACRQLRPQAAPICPLPFPAGRRIAYCGEGVLMSSHLQLLARAATAPRRSACCSGNGSKTPTMRFGHRLIHTHIRKDQTKNNRRHARHFPWISP